MTTRYPVLRRPQWAVDLLQQKGTYPQTGEQAVRDSVRREAPPAPPAPVGEQALQAEIAANQARTAEIRAELAGLEEAYSASALEWDTAQSQTAKVSMLAAADKMRSLRHEQNDLADDLPRLQKRLQAAQRAKRDAEHTADLAELERGLDEFGPVVAEYQQLAYDLVVLADELTTRRSEINRLRRRTNDYATYSGLPRCERDINKEAFVPLFDVAWLQGGTRALELARRELGLD